MTNYLIETYTDTTTGIEEFFNSLLIVANYSTKEVVMDIADEFKTELLENTDTELEEGKLLLQSFNYWLTKLQLEYTNS